MTTNYVNTLIEIAEDSTTDTAIMPDTSKDSVAAQQFRMISAHPYVFTSDDVIFARVAARDAIPVDDQSAAQEAYFRTGRACLRTSPLAKSYGWGIHADGEGRIALIACESETYRSLQDDAAVAKVKAMRRSRH